MSMTSMSNANGLQHKRNFNRLPSFAEAFVAKALLPVTPKKTREKLNVAIRGKV